MVLDQHPDEVLFVQQERKNKPMITRNGCHYAESLEEYYAICGDAEHKPLAQHMVEQNIDMSVRLGLTDKEYEALKRPIRIYGEV
jgi:hypothetical protein